MYKEIKGDLIALAKTGKFDVICHGVNCFCVQGAGLAPQMVKAFGTDKFDLENQVQKGDINKLGQIEHRNYQVKNDKILPLETFSDINLSVINAYTQYDYRRGIEGDIQLDYEALTLCLRKINKIFKGKHIGLPRIGCGLANGNWQVVRKIIQDELKDMEISIVNL